MAERYMQGGARENNPTFFPIYQYFTTVGMTAEFKLIGLVHSNLYDWNAEKALCVESRCCGKH